ncbi:DNA-3-methyladenine glycosylase 2 family protein [Nocardiopsis alborubida]|uniref:DNA-3-methyladenine glycosylase II n=1 Tax=Nocardiopsis alborubida TaxID=146802 RepID=A0A7X6RU65_9ACTN|nr:AlkA N-terminal domain-containing protein [Nocardiopsis alborubida]NKZ02113.1 DNA-3-methyladenine glycosylase 2 family protein [Nocardiopsis alborubida]
MDDDQRYRAVHSRDARFDGVFYTAVRTTGIYCRPSCPAVTPKRVNVRFFPTAAAAQESGFRACKRCRPDLTPGSPEWNLRADVVGRAMRLIQDGAVDRGGVSALASAVGYSERQLNRLLSAEVGAGPLALARTERAQTARVLVETTDMPMADVAFAAGFASVRQFNETMRAVFDRSPSEMRTMGSGRGSASGGPRAAGARPEGTEPGTVTLRLPYREPIDLAQMLRFLGDRAVPGVEEYRDGVYRRTLMLAHGPAVVELSEGARAGRTRRAGAAGSPRSTESAHSVGGASAGGGGHVLCRLRLSEARDLTSAVRRCRRLLDLDADPRAVAEALGGDPLLGPMVAAHPGLRSPGHVDPAELAVRAVLGQQVSVRAARTLAGRLVERFGEPLAPGLEAPGGGLTHVFPSPDVLAAADPTGFSIPVARGRALAGLCEAIASGWIDLGPGCDRDEVERRLVELRGIGPWTAGYVRMRGLGDPDVFLHGDLGVRMALEAAGMRATPAAAAREARAWSPWRSYANHALWASLADRERESGAVREDVVARKGVRGGSKERQERKESA